MLKRFITETKTKLVSITIPVWFRGLKKPRLWNVL
jgi:hypothetical protein